MLRQTTPYQFDLFFNQDGAETVRVPQWRALPAETRRSVTQLMVSLILDHVGGERNPPQEEVHGDA